MSNAFIFLWMIFFHIVDDFVLQAPCLCSLKQKSWWVEHAPDDIYSHDYIFALIIHSISWSFMIMLPIAYVQGFNIDFGFFALFVVNTVIHGIVDNAKANCKVINLCIDQTIHIFQIYLTLMILCV